MLGSPELLSLIVEAAQDYAFIVVDSARTIVGWNTGAERLLGWKESEIIGQDASIFFTPEDRATGIVEREFEKAKRDGRADDHRWHLKIDDTRFFASGWLYRIESGEFQGFVKVIRDLTEIKLSEEKIHKREQQFNTLAENLPEFVFISSPEGKLTYLSPNWTEYTGLTLAQTDADGGMSVMHPDDVSVVREAWQKALQNSEPFEVQFRCRRRDGVYRWFLSRAYPVRDAAGTVEQWVGSSTDIEEQKRTQAEIEALNTRLKYSMVETHHRVKNNLQLMSALIDIQAMNDAASITGAARERLTQQIHALATIHDFLTQQANADEDTTHVPITSVLVHLLPLIQRTNPNRYFRTDIEPLVFPVRKSGTIALLISECISNAVKHGRGKIGVSLKSDPANPENAVLVITDDGDGFPADFDPKQAANTGLFLIEQSVRWDLKGDILYSNLPEGGACLTITFPIE